MRGLLLATEPVPSCWPETVFLWYRASESRFSQRSLVRSRINDTPEEGLRTRNSLKARVCGFR
jgi:hypothetical protein